MAYIFAAARALVALGWLIPAATTTAREADIPRYTEKQVTPIQVASTNDDVLKALDGIQRRLIEQDERLRKLEGLGIARSIPAPEGKAVNSPSTNMKKIRGWKLTYYDQYNPEKPELARDTFSTSLFTVSVLKKYNLAVDKLAGVRFEGKLVITEAGRHTFRYGYWPTAMITWPSCHGWLKFNGKTHQYDPSNYRYQTFIEDLEPGVYDISYDLACKVVAATIKDVTFSLQYLKPNSLEHEALDSTVVYHEVDAQVAKSRRRL